MNEYFATFHTHLSALITNRSLTALGIHAQMLPVPRKLSSSCGTCVRYLSNEPNLTEMDEDVEGVYQKINDNEYVLLMEQK